MCSHFQTSANQATQSHSSLGLSKLATSTWYMYAASELRLSGDSRMQPFYGGACCLGAQYVGLSCVTVSVGISVFSCYTVGDVWVTLGWMKMFR